MTIYLVNLAIVILLGNLICLNKKHGKALFMILVCLQLILLCGLRAETVGWDTSGYVNSYYPNVIQTPVNAVFFKVFNREIGYYLLTKLVSFISTAYPLLLIVVSAIPIILLCVTVYKYSKDVVLSMTIFIALRPYAFLFTGIRESIALGICFYAYRFIREKRFIPFVACVAIASTFHVSAIVFLIAYVFNKIKLNIQNFVISVLAVLLVFMLRNPILAMFGASFVKLGYLYSLETNFKDGMSTILTYSLMFMVGLMHRKQMVQRDEKANIFFSFILFSIVLYGLGYLASPFTRIAMYFGWFIVLFIPQITSIFKVNRERVLVKFGLYAILFFQFLYFGPGFSLVPYKFFWE